VADEFEQEKEEDVITGTKLIGSLCLIAFLCIVWMGSLIVADHHDKRECAMCHSLSFSQTPPINTERIGKLEQSQERQDDRLDTIQKQHGEEMKELGEVKAATTFNRELLMLFAGAMFTLLGASLLQGRKTHRMMNGAQTLLRDDLEAAHTTAAALRKELAECFERDKCPLLTGKAKLPETGEDNG
jgi:hypothetical protein